MKTNKSSYVRAALARKNQKIYEEDLKAIEGMGRAKKTALAILNTVCDHPVINIQELADIIKVSKWTTTKIVKRLVDLEILLPMRKGKQRYQVYCYARAVGTAKELYTNDLSGQTRSGVWLNFDGRTEAIAEAYTSTNIKFHEDKRHNNKENNKHSKNSLYICDCIDGLKYLIKDKVKPYDLIFCDPPFNQITARKTREYIDCFDQHSGYLQFMYPKLLLCKQLLAETGLMIIAIGETEYAHTKLICEEIFESNFINAITIETGVVGGIYASHSNQMLPSVKQYQLLVYAKDRKKINFLNKLYNLVDNKKFAKEYNTIITPDLKHEHLIDYLKKEPWIVSEFEDHELNMTLNNVDKLMSVSQRFEDYMYEKVAPLLYKATPPFRTQSEIAKIQPYDKVFLSEDNRLLLKQKSKPEAKIVEYKPFVNRVLDTGLGVQRGDLWKGFQRYKNSVQDRFGITFEGRKPIPLLQDLLVWINNKHARILDITAGSGSLGTATLAQNIKDSGQRCFCLIQIRERTQNETNKKFKTVDKKTVFALNNSIKELGTTEGYKIYRGTKP